MGNQTNGAPDLWVTGSKEELCVRHAWQQRD